MTSLILAALFFLALHLVVSASALRDRLIGLLGENGYRLVFSLASFAGVIWLVLGYRAAPAMPLWDAGLLGRGLAVAVMPLSTILVVAGVTGPNPTAMVYRGTPGEASARGILRITRHPVMAGIALWAALHLIANGDAAAAVFFATFLVTAAVGPAAIDRRRARRWGEAWEGFAAATSALPFAAIAEGRNRLAVGEIGGWRIGLGVLLYAILLGAHRWAFGVSPLVV